MLLNITKQRLWHGCGCINSSKVLIQNLWSLHTRLLSASRSSIDEICIIRHVTTHHCGWEGADVSVYCHVDTSNAHPTPQLISISQWQNKLQCIITMAMFSCYHINSANKNREEKGNREFLIKKIQFCADILFVFCEWVTYSGLSPLEQPISYFTVWLLKLPLKICAVLSNWKHEISIMISQYSVSQAVKYY